MVRIIMRIDVTNIKKIMQKLRNKDPVLFIALQKKIAQLGSMDTVAAEHLKNLKGSMSHLKRVHVGSLVLIFSIEGETIIFKDLVHHDDAY